MGSMQEMVQNAINAALERTGLGPADLAKRAGIEYRKLWRWRNGESMPRDYDRLIEQLNAVSGNTKEWNIDD